MSLPPPEHPEDSLNDDATPAQPIQLSPSAQDPGAPGPDFGTWVRRTPRRQPSISSPQTVQLSPPRRWIKRLAIATGILALVLVLIVIISAIALRHAMHASLPQLDGTLPIAGLTAPVTITRDPQGVPSIHAANLDDLLFAQGYITASDRLFQMDALRRHGAGELAEILGPSLIQHDREQRILQLRAAADRATAVLPPDQLHQLQAYARGVNAFITTHSAHKPSPSAQDDLPVEFHILHYTPAPWTPRDSLLIALVMSQDLSTSFPTKLNREALSAHLPASLLPDLYPTGSWRDHPPTQTSTDLTTPAGTVEQIPLDRTQSSCADGECSISPSPTHNSTPALHASNQSRVPHLRDGLIVAKVGCTMSRQPGCPQPVLSEAEGSGFSDMGSQDALRTAANLSTPHDPTFAVRAGPTPHDLLTTYADLRSNQCEGCKAGSNNWAVAGTHTATGAPLLSNDMHLSLTAPDIWYEATLHVNPAGCPGSGFSDPGSQDASDPPPALEPPPPSNPAVCTPLNVTGFTLPGVPFVIVGRNSFVSWGFTNSGADVQDVLIEHLRNHNTEYERPDHTWSPIGHQIEHIHVRAGHDITLDVLTTTHTIGATTITTPIISPLYPSEHRALALAWTIYDPSTITAPFLSIDTATDAASLVAAFASFSSVSQNLVYADAHHIGYHLLGRIPIRGPAIQHPRPTQPFILPDTTPSEDEEDESGDPDASLLAPPTSSELSPSSELATSSERPSPLLVFRRHPERSEGPPHLLLANTTQTLSSRPKRTARSGEIPAFLLASTPLTLSSRPESAHFADAVERPAVLARSAQTSSSRPERAARSGEIPAFVLANTTQTLSSRPESAHFADAVERPAVLARSAQTSPSGPERTARSGEIPAFLLASTPRSGNTQVPQGFSLRSHTLRRKKGLQPLTNVLPSPSAQDLPTTPTTAYTIGSPISPIPIDALDPAQIWSGYIPYDALPSVLDPTSGILATANARIVTDTYPYFIANNWVDAYRVERINHLLESAIASGKPLTPADMLRIQTDVHSEFDLLIAQRLAYALDHSALTKKDPRLHHAADLLRDWNGNVTANSSAAAIVAAARSELWPMLLAPQLRAHDHPRTRTHLKLPPSAQNQDDDLIDLYTWEESDSALEQILQHTPARWLPHAFTNWNDFLTTALERGLRFSSAPSNLSTWTYGSIRPVEIPHPIFGSHSPISTLLGVPTGSGLHPHGGDTTTIDASDLHFGPSERFTADLANSDNTHANITTGESGNPSSPWFLDQFLPWLNGTTFPLPLDHPPTTHTLTLTPTVVSAPSS